MNNAIKSYMHVGLVLDASGSMSSLRSTTIESLKKFFDGLRSAEDRTLLDVWQFDSEVKHLVDAADINAGAPETLENYTTGGCTALYDAICTGIDDLGRRFAAMSEAERPDGVVFAILTDGFENSSREFTRGDVRTRIEHQAQKYSWDFRFLAANQDAITTGRDFGLAEECCATFTANRKGMETLCGCEGAFFRDVKAVRRASRIRRALRIF